MNILLCLSHSIEEYDQLRLLSGLGYGVASIGGYIDPAHPHDDKRPALDIPCVQSIKDAVDGLGTTDNLGVAQTHIPDAALDWLGDDGVIVYHHNLHRLFGQWPRIRDWMNGSSRRRVVWRSVGQSVANNETEAAPFRRDGLERVAYSPKEANIPGYTGHDALIRFYKDPDEYTGWTGQNPVVVNFTQHHETPHGRDQWVNWGFWEQATEGLPTAFYGPHSELIGGHGSVSQDEMIRVLQTSRAYLYTGTQPASYTLGLIEAMMVGIPVVSIGPEPMTIFPYGPLLFEGHELTEYDGIFDRPEPARMALSLLLNSHDWAREVGHGMRQGALGLFGKAIIAPKWRAFLG